MENFLKSTLPFCVVSLQVKLRQASNLGWALPTFSLHGKLPEINLAVLRCFVAGKATTGKQPRVGVAHETRRFIRKTADNAGALG